MISGIVMKLLEKAAEERYQNSYGLMHDLQECVDQIDSYFCISLTPLSKVYQEMYQRNDPIILNIPDYFTREPGKIIRVMYIPR